MLNFIGGIVGMVIVAGLFWLCLPRDGKSYRFADTAWDPYFGVVFSVGFALCLMATIYGVVQFFA